jgi:hypothetical protein
MSIRKISLVVLIIVLAASFVFAQSDSVYITPTGKKYHRASCRTIKNSRITEISRDAAVSRGYGACKVCRP